MSNINRDYLIVLDAKSSEITQSDDLIFYVTDEHTANIFVNLVVPESHENLRQYVDVHDPEKYFIEMHIIDPSNDYVVIEGELISREDSLWQLKVPNKFSGSYKCEIRTHYNNESIVPITTSNKIKYKVKKSIVNDLDDIVDAPEYPVVIRLLDKLSDIELYEDERRTNELARQLAEQQRQVRYDELAENMEGRITSMDNKITEVEDRVVVKEQAVDKLIVDTKKDIDDYKVAKDAEINDYKNTKDAEINQAITDQNNKITEAISNQNEIISDAIANQNNKIDTAIEEQNNRITTVESNDTVQDNRLDELEAKDIAHESRITSVEEKNVEQDNRLDIIENVNQQQTSRLDSIEAINTTQNSRLDSIEAVNVSQGTRLDTIEIKNQQQDDRLLDVEKVNKRQDMDLKCLFAESKNNMINVTEEGNSIYLQNSTVGYTLIDEIQGQTLVNCNKEPDKEIILNGNINTEGYSNVTLTEGVDGGLVDIALEGNTMVNVCDQKDPVAITKSYTVETGNHIALQGEYDGKCIPVVTGNTLVNLIDGFSEAMISQDTYKATNKGFTLNKLHDGGISYFKYKLRYPLDTSKKYTIIYDIVENTLVNTNPGYGIYTDGVYGAIGSTTTTGGSVDGKLGKMVSVHPVKSSTDYQYTLEYLSIGVHQGDSEGKVVIDNLMLLEGDYTNKPIPGYFEGLQSSFEDKVVTQEMVDAGEELAENLGKYKVDYVVTGKNKFNINSIIGKDKVTIGANLARYANPIKLKPNTTYVATSNCYNYIASSIFISISSTQNPSSSTNGLSSTGRVITTDNTGNLYLMLRTGGDEYVVPTDNDFSNGTYWLQLEEGNTATTYEPYKEYKKTFYLNSPLLEGDTIIQSGNNVVHVHRYSKVKLNDLFLGTGQVFDNGVLHFGNNKYLHAQDTNNTICDKMITTLLTPSVSSTCNAICTKVNPNQWRIYVPTLTTLDEYIDWIANSDINIVYELSSPTYEVISQNDTILCDSYVNGHLDVDSVVPIEKVVFRNNIYPLKYIYPSTEYIIQFESDNTGELYLYMAGVAKSTTNIVKGINKFNLTTNSTIPYASIGFSGIGFNASKIVVTEATDQDFGYFEGMKSVGECEDLEVVSCNKNSHAHNTQTLTHEPLRAVGDIKDKYVLIDGKWYIERNVGEHTFNGGNDEIWRFAIGYKNTYLFYIENVNHFNMLPSTIVNNKIISYSPNFMSVSRVNGFDKPDGGLDAEYTNAECLCVSKIKVSGTAEQSIKTWLQSNPQTIIYRLLSPTYEPIDYNPFEVYSDITHISNNSTIPCNMVVKNTGYNCLLKPSTTYTVSSNLGLNVVTTPSVLSEDCLRFYDTDTSNVTTMRDVMVLEGDYTTGKPIPSHFSGIESAFEQEYDEEKCKYKVKIRVQNEDASKENYIEFYIDEPLRGIENVKDKVYVKNDKVVVERNCGSVTFDGSDDEKWGIKINTKVNTIMYLMSLKNITHTNLYTARCDKFNNIDCWNNDYEGIQLANEIYIRLSLHRSKANSVEEFKQWLSENPVTVVYQLAEPTYEEVEYNDVKLFIESFKNSTLFYNSNIPVTSKLWYSYSIPLVDTVAQTASISDEQDTMIIDLAVQVAVMEMMLM